MFLNYIKDFIVKKTLKRNLKDLNTIFSDNLIVKVGLLVDASNFLDTDKLINSLISNGIKRESITTIIYSDNSKKDNSKTGNSFSYSSLNWKGQIVEPMVNDFIAEKFDLLINYYEVEKAILLQITRDSQAEFKVGFASVDKRLNHFIIKTDANTPAVFTDELFKYLKLLNKI